MGAGSVVKCIETVRRTSCIWNNASGLRVRLREIRTHADTLQTYRADNSWRSVTHTPSHIRDEAEPWLHDQVAASVYYATQPQRNECVDVPNAHTLCRFQLPVLQLDRISCPVLIEKTNTLQGLYSVSKGCRIRQGGTGTHAMQGST